MTSGQMRRAGYAVRRYHLHYGPEGWLLLDRVAPTSVGPFLSEERAREQRDYLEGRTGLPDPHAEAPSLAKTLTAKALIPVALYLGLVALAVFIDMPDAFWYVVMPPVFGLQGLLISGWRSGLSWFCAMAVVVFVAWGAWELNLYLWVATIPLTFLFARWWWKHFPN